MCLREKKNIMQNEVDKVINFSKLRKITLNRKKTKCMLFKPLKNTDYQPQISIDENN